MHVTEIGRCLHYVGSMDKNKEDSVKESKDTLNPYYHRSLGATPLASPPVRCRLRVDRRRRLSRDSFPDLPLIGPNRLPLEIKMAA